MIHDFKKLRIGNGYDVHAFEKGRKLFLGGVEIPHDMGLKGHSDADVLLHAIIDSLLGASGISDIGQLFPDDDNSYKGIRSTLLLQKVNQILKERGVTIINIDSVLVCERPKISPYKNQMIETISDILSIERDCINIKGKTSEKMGFAGREEGIIAYSSALIFLN